MMEVTTNFSRMTSSDSESDLIGTLWHPLHHACFHIVDEGNVYFNLCLKFIRITLILDLFGAP